ncbi:glutathione S-transferase N-terminal domain-containing protein [Sphingorhabdus sp. Alg231-15]|uniref:glutathione S-transferase N-terminal domain-containing protein n=1 Tax=Sphingorhabdus sp. Alg231-15 TaxID=1922222 RepID=UPI000D554A08
MIDLYTSTTPNGRKISIALEEMGLPYQVHAINLQNDEQYAPDFLKISPNNKIPAIVDSDNGVSVFESGAILTYLAEKTGQFLPTDTPARIEVLEWLAWQTAGLGPMLGQLNHFLNVADEKLPYAIKRFSDEMIRLLGVLDKQLAKHENVAGDYSIADMAIYPWSSAAYDGAKALIGTSFKNLETWHETMAARPAVQAGMAVPDV